MHSVPRYGGSSGKTPVGARGAKPPRFFQNYVFKDARRAIQNRFSTKLSSVRHSRLCIQPHYDSNSLSRMDREIFRHFQIVNALLANLASFSKWVRTLFDPHYTTLGKVEAT